MKSSIKVLSLLAVAAMTLIGCSKSEDVSIANDSFTHRVTIKASNPTTKTVIVEGETSASFKWSSDDATRFVVKENETAGKDIELNSTDNYVTMTLGATFESVVADEYIYTASLSKNRTTTSGAPKIPAAQTSSATSYDPDADILVATPLTFDTPQDELSMQFKRPVVINKMTLKGLTVGETISTVKITSDKDIVGYYQDPNWGGQGKEITVTVNQEVPASGDVVVYFVSMPVDAAILSIEATSGNYVFSKTFSRTINLIANQVTLFSVSGFNKEEKVDYSGTYVLANAAENKIATAWANGNNLPAIDVTKEGDILYYDPDAVNLDAAKVTLARIEDEESEYYSMYTMKQNNLYLYAAGSGSNNYLKGEAEADVNAYWEVSNSDSWSIVASKSTNNNTLQYNNGNSFFSCYASATQTAVSLVDVANFKPTPVINASDTTITAAAITTPTAITCTFNSNSTTKEAQAFADADCTIASDWLTADVDDNKVKITASKNQTAETRVNYIKITANNSDGRSVSKVVSVTQSEPGVAIYTYIFTSKTWNATRDGNPANWTGDEAGNYENNFIQIYKSNISAVSGDTFTDVEKVTVTYKTSKNGAGKITVKVGDSEQSVDVTKGTAETDQEFSFAVKKSGPVTISVNCSKSSIYISKVAIKAKDTL